TARPRTYTLSLHDALPILKPAGIFNRIDPLDPRADRCERQGQRLIGLDDDTRDGRAWVGLSEVGLLGIGAVALPVAIIFLDQARSEEHTSELQSRENLVCR